MPKYIDPKIKEQVINEYKEGGITKVALSKKYSVSLRSVNYWIEGINLDSPNKPTKHYIYIDVELKMLCKYCKGCERHLLLFKGDI